MAVNSYGHTICSKCGSSTSTTYWYLGSPGEYVCDKCHEEEKTLRLSAIRNSITQTSDWAAYSNEDMSEIFWREITAYQKRPNKKSLSLIHTCCLWAHHDDHALANSFRHALDWAKINMVAEYNRNDLPEE